MINFRNILLVCLLVLCTSALLGCGKKADESKAIAEIKAEVEKMDVEQIRSMALKYKDAIMAKQEEVTKITAELKKIPVADMLGKEAKALKADIDELTKSVSSLKERFQVYYDKLKEKGGDLSGLKL